MQKNLIKMLENKKIELQRINMITHGETEESREIEQNKEAEETTVSEINKEYEKSEEDNKNEVYRIMDRERLIFLVEIGRMEDSDISDWVNKLMDWVTYEQQEEEKKFVERYQQITMRQILWDIYVIFIKIQSGEAQDITEEEIYRMQRDSRLMKRYIVQGATESEIAEKICFIVKPQEKIDDFIHKLDFDHDEEENCRKMCIVGSGDKSDSRSSINTYQKIIDLLNIVNEETFGDDADENT